LVLSIEGHKSVQHNSATAGCVPRCHGVRTAGV